MAKNDKELTVEERLKALFDLQKILSQVDEYKIQRGELPLEVKDKEDEIMGLETRIQNLKGDLERFSKDDAEQRRRRDEAIALIDRYAEQQETVRNNREYDYLSKEIEYQKLEIQAAEKKLRDIANATAFKQDEIANTEDLLANNRVILEEKRQELAEIISETKQDEEKLLEKAKKLEGKIEQRLLMAFKRIRKNARNGLGIAIVRKSACGGCFNRMPPQRQTEIKLHKKIVVCEYCGRILIDPELAGVPVEIDPNQTKPKRGGRRKLNVTK